MRHFRLQAGGGAATILCLGAHCDDIEIGCGGLLAQLCAMRPAPAVYWFIPVAPAARAAESRQAAQRLLAGAGSFSLETHEFTDGELPYAGAELKRRVQDLARRLAPDVVLTHWGGDAHQDHRCLSELTRQAFRDHLILEYEIPKYDGDLGRPNWFAPLEAAIAERKIDCLLECFGSQTGKHWFHADTLRGLLRLRGVECRAPSGFAEAFYLSKGVWSVP
jgi:LmbE family N-acetylglucosaminyl deacetylase